MPSQTTGVSSNANIQPADAGALIWECDDPDGSLARLLTYVESEAVKATAWYCGSPDWA